MLDAILGIVAFALPVFGVLMTHLVHRNKNHYYKRRFELNGITTNKVEDHGLVIARFTRGACVVLLGYLLLLAVSPSVSLLHAQIATFLMSICTVSSMLLAYFEFFLISYVDKVRGQSTKKGASA